MIQLQIIPNRPKDKLNRKTIGKIGNAKVTARHHELNHWPSS